MGRNPESGAGMGVIVLKRVYDPPAATDGFRVLVDRLWPRGMTKEAAHLDLWAKDLAPSPELRKEFNHKPERFAEFTHHYLSELARNPAVAAFRAELKRPKVTLLYGAHDRANNHAVVLVGFLKKGGAAKRAMQKPPAREKAKAKKRKTQAAAARKRSR